MKVSLRTCLMICILSLSQNALAENEFKKIGKALIKAIAEPASDTPPTAQVAQAASVSTAKNDDREYFQKPEVNGNLTYELFVDPQQIFPSIILTALDGAKNANKRKNYELGDLNGAFDLIAQSKIPNQKVKVKVYKNNFINQDTENDFTLSDPNTIYNINPTIAWDFDKLSHIRQPINETFKIEIHVEGQPVIVKIIQPRIRSVNDAILAIKDRKGKESYLAPITFAGYVNENSPIIDQVLKETKELAIKAEIMGTKYDDKGNPVSVPLDFGAVSSGASQPVDQVAAIWFYLQSKHYKYSSVTMPSGFNENVISQSVRTVDDTYNATQANCVDGSVFLASILTKVGIEANLVLRPGHMYLMFYNDKDKKQPVFLETTMMGNFVSNVEDGAKVKKAGLFKKLLGGKDKNPFKDEFLKSVSNFQDALNEGSAKWNQDLPNFKAKQNPLYGLSPIIDLRKMGINPINR